LISTPHSQAQCQVALTNAKPKPVIELVCLPTLTLLTLKKLNLLRQKKQNERIEKISQTIERQ